MNSRSKIKRPKQPASSSKGKSRSRPRPKSSPRSPPVSGEEAAASDSEPEVDVEMVSDVDTSLELDTSLEFHPESAEGITALEDGNGTDGDKDDRMVFKKPVAKPRRSRGRGRRRSRSRSNSSSASAVVDACDENEDLSKVTPAFEILTKSNTQIQAAPKPGVPVDKGLRGQKRKAAQDSVLPANQKAKKGEVPSCARLALHGYPTEHPFNKDSYRYVLAEPDPHAPNRQAFDESIEWAGKPIPGYLYRTFLGSDVLLALHDRAPQLKISEDRLTVTGEKGYSMIRATHGIRRGSWYYEVKLEGMGDNEHVRIGWSQMLGNLQAPCGYDKFSYSWRSRKGSKCHQSYCRLYSDPCKEGDVMGFLIYLPEPDDPHNLLPVTYKDKPLVKFKNHLYYEEKDKEKAEAERNLKVATGSKITFFLNGRCLGVAFDDIFDGTYYPAISLYHNAKVTANFGPTFKCPPQTEQSFRPMSDTATLTMVENTLADMLFHVENEGKLPDFQA